VPLLDLVRLERSSEQPSKSLLKADLEQLSNVNFPILRFENRTLARLVAETLKKIPFAREEGLGEDRIDALMLRICRGYNVVSYHNFSHAFSLFLVGGPPLRRCSINVMPSARTSVNS